MVTGAGGFIGSHLTEQLIKLGADVTAFVKYNSRNDWGLIEDIPRENKTGLKVTMGDLKDPDVMRRVCKDKDVVFHLGANIAIPYSYLNPRDHVETNVIGTFNVMVAARDEGVKKVVHTSTSEVYGTAKYTPIDEKHSLQGQSPYSASKIGADKVAESFYLSYGLPVVTVRPFNTYGPRQSARAIIPTIITQALTNDQIRLGSLTPKRDFTFVKDIADGFVNAAESDKAVGEVINLGSGTDISVGKLAQKITYMMRKKCSILKDKKRVRPEKSEVMQLISDIKKARKVIGWEPKTDFDTGLKATIEYIKSNISKYKASIYNI